MILQTWILMKQWDQCQLYEELRLKEELVIGGRSWISSSSPKGGKCYVGVDDKVLMI